jgi:hypothetical protein
VKNIPHAEIHHKLTEVCREDVMNEGNMIKWCHLINEGRTDAQNGV